MCGTPAIDAPPGIGPRDAAADAEGPEAELTQSTRSVRMLASQRARVRSVTSAGDLGASVRCSVQAAAVSEITASAMRRVSRAENDIDGERGGDCSGKEPDPIRLFA